MLDFAVVVEYNIATMNFGGTVMLKIPELAIPKSLKVTTVCNGKREVWTDCEEAKSYFLEMMMTTDGEDHDRYECIYIQLVHRLSECSDE